MAVASGSPGGDVRGCAVCGSTRKRVLFRQRFSALSSGCVVDGYDVVICPECGFGYADGIPDQAALDVYYREMSKYEHQDSDGQPTDFEERHFPEVAAIVRRYVPSHDARIFEIGCATGRLLFELKENGYRHVLGLDPSPVCAETARCLYGIDVRTGSLADLESDVGRFELVVMVAVLEHIRDLGPALARVRGLLSPGGMLYIEVPDAASFARSPDAPFQEFSIEHINFFSKTSLTNLLARHGFRVAMLQQTSSDQTSGKTGYEIKAILRADDAARSDGLVVDAETQVGLSAYISQSQEAEHRIHKIVDDLVARRKAIVVWGVGTHTQRLMATSRLSEVAIEAFADSNPRYHGKQLHGIPIIAPGDVRDFSTPILISSRVFQSAIEEQIRRDLGLSNEIITLYALD